jgi:cytochrome c biogenesis protein CcdA
MTRNGRNKCLVSALAGLGSFVSPCILPILPAFISYLSGTSISEIQKSAEYNNGNEIHPRTLQSQNVMGKLQQPLI